jgi:anti-sigma-K factor RskA
MAEKRGAFGNIIGDLSSLRDMFSKEDENLKNEEEQKTKLEELLDFQTAKEEYKPTEEQKAASTIRRLWNSTSRRNFSTRRKRTS